MKSENYKKETDSEVRIARQQILAAAALAGAIGLMAPSATHHLQLLNNRAGPAVRDDHRQGIAVLRAFAVAAVVVEAPAIVSSPPAEGAVASTSSTSSTSTASVTRRKWETLYGLDDSPIALAAWMLDHDPASQALIGRVFDGQTEGLTRDDVLDNITLYWLTNTGLSSGRLFWESKLAFFAPKGVTIPVAVSAFPDEIYTAPRSWTEKAFPKLIFYKRHAKGGHFAAWEQPQALTEDIREGFRPLR